VERKTCWEGAETIDGWGRPAAART
jgi:hypothetical protein